MLNTDYSKIAEKYDANIDRHEIPKDPVINEILKTNLRPKILDLACGTGNYEYYQNKYYAGNKIEWHGVDKSEEMINIAKEKNSEAKFMIIDIDSDNLEIDSYDYVICNFAFHQFENKAKVIDKIRLSLKSGGVFKMKNIIPEFIEKWWVYYYCPETYYEDMHRFWKKDLFVYELEKRKLKTFVDISYKEDYREMERIKQDYLNRDNSQLAMINDFAYKNGLKKIDIEIENGKKEYRNVFSLIEVTSYK